MYSAFTYLYDDGDTKVSTVFPANNLWPAIRYRSPILPSTSLIRRSALVQIGGFYKVHTEDWDLFFRLVDTFSPAAFHGIPESLVLYRQVKNSLSRNYRNMFEGRFDMLNRLLLTGLQGTSRALWERRIKAKFYYEHAMSMRENGNSFAWHYIIQSLTTWPFFGQVVTIRRYKVATSMLLKRAKNRR